MSESLPALFRTSRRPDSIVFRWGGISTGSGAFSCPSVLLRCRERTFFHTKIACATGSSGIRQICSRQLVIFSHQKLRRRRRDRERERVHIMKNTKYLQRMVLIWGVEIPWMHSFRLVSGCTTYKNCSLMPHIHLRA